MTEKVDDIYTNSEIVEFPGGMSITDVSTDRQLERGPSLGRDLMRCHSLILPMRKSPAI